MSRVGLVASPVAALGCFLILPETYTDATGASVSLGAGGRATIAVALWMALWWMTEAIPIYATALLPVALLPLVGAVSFPEAARPYAHEMVFLFLGGFLLGLALQRWQLDRRVALATVRAAGTEWSRIVGAMMAVTAFLSMWVSNTATAVMMLPIAMSVIRLALGVDEGAGDARDQLAAATGPERRFAVCLLLGIAYAATIGGVGTLIGTPPNLFLASFARESLGIEISFARWMAVGVPLVVVFLPFTWWLLTRVLFPVSGRHVAGADLQLRDAARALGPMGGAERAVLLVFACTATAWICRPLLPFAISDAGIALCGALVLFVIPARGSGGRFLMDWATAERLPWGVLVLFGGGLSLAAAIRLNGVDQWLGAQASAASGAPAWLLVVGVAAAVIFLTELTSNTATSAALIPILAALAPALGVPPLQLIVPAAIAASCAFMLPVATPPNAVVFGAGVVRIPDMCRAGIALNLAGVAAIAALTYALALPLLSHP